MKIKDLKPLKVSLHGMDERMQKMMANYLKLPCRGTVIVVSDEIEAHAEIVDVDLALSKTLLDDRLKTSAPKPIIALSLNPISKDGVIYLKKPIQVKEVMAAFDLARNVIIGKKTLEAPQEQSDTNAKTSETTDNIQASIIKDDNNVPVSKTEIIKKSQLSQKQITDQSIPKKDINDASPKKVKDPSPRFLPEETDENLKNQDFNTRSENDSSDFIAKAIKKSQPSEKQATEQHIVTKDKKTTPLEKTSQPLETNKESTEPVSKPVIQQVSDAPKPKEYAKFDKDQEQPSIKPEKIVTKPAPAPPVHFLKKKKVNEKTTATDQPNKQIKDKTLETTKESSPQLKKEPEKAKTTQPTLEKRPGDSFLNAFWQKKGIFLGAASLVMLIAIVHFFQQTSLYEAKARLVIGNENSKNIDLSAPPQTILEKVVIQKKIDEISSKKLIRRVILDLQLNSVPEFIKASDIPNEELESASKIREERLASERMSNMVDYFLQNLKVTQYKNYPIINIAYRSEKPELANKIVNRLTDMYLAIQEEKKAEKMTEIAEWENNKLPMAKNKLKQSQDALALYIEMNKWSQFEQQFAEDMGVNSEIRSLEKKVKADQALYKIMLERFEKLKNSADGKEIKLLSSAELPIDPSYPNKPRFIFWSLLIATLFAIILTAIITVISLLKEPENSLKKSGQALKKAA